MLHLQVEVERIDIGEPGNAGQYAYLVLLELFWICIYFVVISWLSISMIFADCEMISEQILPMFLKLDPLLTYPIHCGCFFPAGVLDCNLQVLF